MYFLKLFLSIPAIAGLLYSGFFLSFSSRWLQVRKLAVAFSSPFRGLESGFTSFTALFAIVGGNLGVGNLSGTAVALRSGGPGFIVWMVFIIVVTSIIKYVTCYISIETKENKNGRVYGGPVVFLKNAFKTKWVSIIAAIATMICALTVGNLVQVNSFAISMHLIEQPPIAAGVFTAVLFMVISVSKEEHLNNIISKIVPAMTIFYFVLSAIALSKSGSNIIPSVKLIFRDALGLQSFRDGAILAFIAEAFAMIQVGTLRGIFATDIGLGLEGTVHSMVKSNETVATKEFALKQSLISLISPFIVALVTLITTMVLLTTGVWTDLSLESTNMCFTAFTNTMGSGYTEYALILLVFCFSFTSIITWFMCSKEVLSYISGDNVLCKRLWTWLFVLVIPIGSVGAVRLLWDIADIAISVSVIVNTLGILLMLKKYKKDMFSI